MITCKYVFLLILNHLLIRSSISYFEALLGLGMRPKSCKREYFFSLSGAHKHDQKLACKTSEYGDHRIKLYIVHKFYSISFIMDENCSLGHIIELE